MFTKQLATQADSVKLIKPEWERDAWLGVKWLSGDVGRRTLQQMGVTAENNVPSSLEAEKQRVRGFLNKKDQLNWMIELDSKVIGSIWVDLEPDKYLQAPSVHIMIGDSAARGQGVGSAATSAVLSYLTSQNYQKIFSRYLTSNEAAANLLEKLGFKCAGDTYRDEDKLLWQNVAKEL